MATGFELLKVGNTVSVELYGAISGVSHITGTILGESLSPSLLPNPEAAMVNNTNILPNVPTDTRTLYADADGNITYESYNYYVVESDDGSRYYLGKMWINSNTIKEVNLSGFNAVLGSTELTAEEIRLLLEQAGVPVISITSNA